MALLATCLSVIAQGPTKKNSLVVKGQMRDAGVVDTVSGSVADLLHKLEQGSTPSARNFPRLPFSCHVQLGCEVFGMWKDLSQS